MTYKRLLISLLLIPALAFGANEPSQKFLDTLALAEGGDAGAQFNLGYMYDFGEGVPQNDDKAVRWYRLAAEQGDVDAQYNLGFMYTDGVGVPQNNVRAYVWFSVSAAQGDEPARTNIDIIAKSLTPAQLAQGQEQATRCFKSDFQDCE